jgi:hypothetical protein
MPEVVEKGAQLFENIENKAKQLREKTGGLATIFATANSLGMMGALQTQRMIADVGVAEGHLANFLALIMRLHVEATQIAQDNGVDIPVVAGGGPR